MPLYFYSFSSLTTVEKNYICLYLFKRDKTTMKTLTPIQKKLIKKRRRKPLNVFFTTAPTVPNVTTVTTDTLPVPSLLSLVLIMPKFFLIE